MSTKNQSILFVLIKLLVGNRVLVCKPVSRYGNPCVLI